jgi:hypothetical protein
LIGIKGFFEAIVDRPLRRRSADLYRVRSSSDALRLRVDEVSMRQQRAALLPIEPGALLGEPDEILVL